MIEARLDTKGFAKMSSLLMEGGTGESAIKVKTLWLAQKCILAIKKNEKENKKMIEPQY